MESLSAFITAHALHAHWVILGAILLAGFNIPFSIDIIVIFGAILAATVVPECMIKIYFSIVVGCMISAWIAYGMGRFLAPWIMRISFIAKLLSPERLEKARLFYEKKGLFALVIGRFIPFGVRNCLFMSAGMSRMSFLKFIGLDAIASLIWCTSSFFLFYALGNNYETLVGSMKVFNIAIFGAFSLALIGVIWYKKRKKSISHDKSI